VARKLHMGLGALNTILTTAPLIIQGAARLVRALKEKGGTPGGSEDIPASLEGLKTEIRRIHGRLDAANEFDIEQIKLIEELAKQNELLAGSLKKSARQMSIIALVAIVALGVAVILVFSE